MSQRLSPGRVAPAQGLAALGVEGGRGQRWAVHLVAVLSVLSMIAGAFFDWVAVAVFALVLGGLTAVRLLRVPPLLQAALGLAALGAAWASALLLYERIWWLDILAHLVLTALLAGAAGAVLRRAQMTPSGDAPRGRWGIVITTTGVGAILAVLWEVAEWIGYLYIDPRIDVAPGDTIGDLVAGLVGAAAAGVLLARTGRQQ